MNMPVDKISGQQKSNKNEDELRALGRGRLDKRPCVVGVNDSILIKTHL
jgi:hypothetical protein